MIFDESDKACEILLFGPHMSVEIYVVLRPGSLESGDIVAASSILDRYVAIEVPLAVYIVIKLSVI